MTIEPPVDPALVDYTEEQIHRYWDRQLDQLKLVPDPTAQVQQATHWMEFADELREQMRQVRNAAMHRQHLVDGHSALTISRRYGISRSQVSAILREHKMKIEGQS